MGTKTQIGYKLAHKRASEGTKQSHTEFNQPSVQPSGTWMSGADVLAYWEQEGLGGVYADANMFPQDSPELARTLRENEEARP